MARSRTEQLSDIVNDAIETPESERAAFVTAACGGDGELLEEVNQLLRFHADVQDASHPLSDARLEQVAEEIRLASESGGGIGRPTRHIDLGDRFGQFRLIGVLGEGGMGVVYEAEQDRPRRMVALKVIESFHNSAMLHRRLEFEADVLGRLQHPAIAQVYDAGFVETPFGQRPFFAMELVKGESLTAYAAAHQLGTRERLALIVKVCAAVEHAHQKGVIHRDLKPANILVNESGLPKVLDFGVARATDGDIQAATMRTDIGALIGTLPYMSPEQASGDPKSLDTRSDVYSLGVIAYQLLADKLPLDMKGKMIHEAVRVILEDDPTSLSVSDKKLRGDIDTIVFKALEKDKDRRYQSAAEFANDIGRYLNDQPILARPASMMYQLRTFTRRHKALVSGVAASFFVLVAAVTLISWQAVVATRQRNDALDARDELQTVSKFLSDMLSSVAPESSGRDVTVKEVLDRGSGMFDDRFDGRPLSEASLRGTIGVAYFEIGDVERADEHLTKSLAMMREARGDDYAYCNSVVESLNSIYYSQQRYGESEALLRKAIEIRSRVLGPDHHMTLMAVESLAWGPLFAQGKREEVKAMLDRVARLSKSDHPDGSPERRLEQLAWEDGLLEINGEIETLLESRREQVALNTQIFGAEHLNTLLSRFWLAYTLIASHNYEEAESVARAALADSVVVFGEDHFRTAWISWTLARVLSIQGDYEEADSLLTRALEINRRELGFENENTLGVMIALASVREQRAMIEDARRLYVESCDGYLSLEYMDPARLRKKIHSAIDFLERDGLGDDAENLRHRLETRLNGAPP